MRPGGPPQLNPKSMRCNACNVTLQGENEVSEAVSNYTSPTDSKVFEVLDWH